MIRIAALVVALFAFVTTAEAGKFNKKLDIGSKAPTFSNLQGVDGKAHSMSDYKKDVMVVCITCNHCPVAVAYEDRMIDFVKKFSDRVDFVAINVNNLDADKLPKMKERAKAKGFNFDYLYDPSQEIATKLGASVTPEYFVLNKDREVIYMGGLDNSMNASRVTKNYLADAVEAALADKPAPTGETKARGCSVKYEN